VAILKKILTGLLVLAVLLVLIGFMLPRKFKVERSLVINDGVLTIYPLIAAPTNWQKWSVWNARDPNMQMTFGGTGAGKGAKWSWQSKTEGDGAMEFVDEDSPRKIGYQLKFADWSMVSTGALTLTPMGEATTNVIWSSEGDLGNNPVFRYFGLFMDRMIGKDFEGGLANLKVLAEKNATTKTADGLMAPASVSPATVGDASAPSLTTTNVSTKEMPAKAEASKGELTMSPAGKSP